MKKNGLIFLWLKYVLPYKKLLLSLILVVLVNSISLTLIPKQITLYVDTINDNLHYNFLNHTFKVSISIATLTILYFFTSLLLARISTKLAWLTTNQLRLDIVEKIMSKHKDNSTGNLMEVVEGDITMLNKFFSTFLIELFISFSIILSAIIIMLMSSVKMALIVILVVLFSISTLYFLRGISNNETIEYRNSIGNYYSLMEEAIFSKKQWKNLNSIHTIISWLDNKTETMQLKGAQAYYKSRLIWPITISIFAISYTMVLGFGGYLFTKGIITFGVIFLAFQYIEIIRKPVETLAQHTIEYQLYLSSAFRISKVFDQDENIDNVKYRNDLIESIIVIKNLSMKYPNGFSALEDINLNIRDKELIAIVGRTGSGKSTLGKVIAGLYPYSNGDLIQFCKRTNNEKLRISYIDQSYEILPGTIRDNITLWKEATNEELIGVLKFLGLLTWLESLEEGLNTYLQSENLTEFYKVLIGYSRAIFFKSDLIILDEQGSGLNKLQLEEISKINFELSKKSSVIVITHNPVLVKNVNRVINMSEGKIIEVDEKYEKNEF